MKTSTFKNIVVLVLLVFSIAANANYSKTVYKSWDIDKVTLLSIENKFGNINFVNKRSDSVTVEVKLEILNSPNRRAEALANQIDFRMELREGNLMIRTVFDNNFRTDEQFNIVYTINIPENKDLNVSNMYGNVTLSDLNAVGKFKISYGNIQARNLLAPGNESIYIDIKYGNAGLNSSNRLRASVGYGRFNADNVVDANFLTEYSSLKINQIGYARITSKYDQFDITNIDVLMANSKFTSWSVNKLAKTMSLETEYGNVKIANVNNGIESINIKNNYGNIMVGIPRNVSYQLLADCLYCDVKHHPGDVEKESKNNRLTVKGKIGNGQATANVRVESKYGKVNLMEQ